MNHLSKLLALLLALVLGACSSSKNWAEYREELQKGHDRVTAGELEAAEKTLEQLLQKSFSEARVYRTQRLVAMSMLARLHMAAAFGTPFLTAPRPRGSFSLSGAGDELPSPESHLVAAQFFSNHGRELVGRVSDKLVVDGQQLLPSDLGEQGLEAARLYLTVALFTIYSRLNFEERIAYILTDIPELKDVDQCDLMLEVAQASPDERIWIQYAVLQHLIGQNSTSASRAAYPFAVRVLEGLEARRELEPGVRDEIVSWILGHETLVWLCPECSEPVTPTSDRCFNCRQAGRREFRPATRSQ